VGDLSGGIAALLDEERQNEIMSLAVASLLAGGLLASALGQVLPGASTELQGRTTNRARPTPFWLMDGLGRRA